MKKTFPIAVQAVMIDLDGTLLDIDLGEFLGDYFAALGPVIAGLAVGISPKSAVAAVNEATDAMHATHVGKSNREVFNEVFLSLTDVVLDSPRVAAAVDEFYSCAFPLLKKGHTAMRGASEAVLAARQAGLLTALATNPIFPRAAIDERIRWAELDQEWFDVITSYEVMEACKPSPRYFEQVASMLNVDPASCLMVGDDPELDLPASEAGMMTFYVGHRDVDSAERRGALRELPLLFGELLS
jgi:FMN phosphatase YigB (HAD superfamily)